MNSVSKDETNATLNGNSATVNAKFAKSVANFGGIKLRSEGGIEWTLDSSIRWIPADEIANNRSLQNGTAHLR